MFEKGELEVKKETPIINRPNGPDPGKDLSEFLNWLLNNHQMAEIKFCKRKIKQKGWEINLDKVIREYHPDYLETGIVRGMNCVRINDVPWAQNWAKYYRNYRGHHGQKRIKPFRN